MSTTIKRIALVAVAALGLGVVSVAPSQAFTTSDSLSLTSATASQYTGETLTAGSAGATLSFLASAAGDTMSVSAYLISAPAGNVAYPELSIVETTNATLATTATGANVAASATFDQVAYVVTTGATKSVSAKFKVYMNAPVKAGTYVIKIAAANLPSTNGVAAATSQTLTITVVQNPSSDTVAASADVVLNSGETNTATTDDVVTHTKDLPASSVADRAAAATLSVSLLNAAGKAANESFTATIAGPGVLGSGSKTATAGVIVGPQPTGRAITVVNGDVVQVFNDGSSGVATITIGSSAGVILATKKVTFYGDAAKIVAASNALTTGSVGVVGTALNLIKFNVTDASGTEVTTGSYFVVSNDLTIANDAAYTSAAASYDAVNGYWTAPVKGIAKGTATLYITNRASASATTPTVEVKSDAVSIRIGSKTPASVTVATDKSSYAPGEKATITVTLKDKDGNVVPSGKYDSIFADGGIAANYSLTGDTLTATSLHTTVDGVQTYSVYMPVTEGDVTFKWTTGSVDATSGAGLAAANQAVKGSLVVSVGSASSAAAIDAANEASQAASDATDAALAAADAADEATTKAQEAVDAVATLSAAVSKMISALKAQITSLSNLVAKIAKKVKA